MTDNVKGKKNLSTRFGTATRRSFFKTFNFASDRGMLVGLGCVALTTFSPLYLTYEAPDTVRTQAGAADVARYTQDIKQWGKSYSQLEQATNLTDRQREARIDQLRAQSGSIANDRDISENDIYNLTRLFKSEHARAANDSADMSVASYEYIIHPTVRILNVGASNLRENIPASGTVTTTHLDAAASANRNYFYAFMGGSAVLAFGTMGLISLNNRRYRKVLQEERTEKAADALNNLRATLTPRTTVKFTPQIGKR